MNSYLCFFFSFPHSSFVLKLFEVTCRHHGASLLNTSFLLHLLTKRTLYDHNIISPKKINSDSLLSSNTQIQSIIKFSQMSYEFLFLKIKFRSVHCIVLLFFNLFCVRRVLPLCYFCFT